MYENQNNLQPDSPYGHPAGYPKDRFIILLIILGLLIAFTTAIQFAARPVDEPLDFSEKTLEADISIKFSYAYERWAQALPETYHGQLEMLMQRERRSAVRAYRNATEQAPALPNIRRLIIIEEPQNREAAIVRLIEHANEEENLRPEIAMWRVIYISAETVTADEVQSYERLIRGLNLGWYENLALEDLYQRANMTQQAVEQRAIAVAQANSTVIRLLVMFVTLALLGLLGIAVIFWYFNAKISGRLPTPVEPESPSPDRGLLAGYMLEAFVVYLAAMIFSQMAGGVLLGAYREITPEVTIQITTGTYIFAGIIAFLFMDYRIKSAGWTWRTIGLTSRSALGDIGWGIAGYGAAIPFLVVAGLLSQLLGRYVQAPPNPIIPMFVESERLFEQLLIFGLAIIAAPVFEEIFFRGALFTSFFAKWGVKAGILLSAVIFAAMHPLPLGFLPIFALGCVLATLFYERRSLLSVIVMHAINNGVAFTLLAIISE